MQINKPNYRNSSIKLKDPSTALNFGAGWSARIEKKIQECKVQEITDTFKRQGIDTDFKGNKVLAWCSLKTLEIFNELNKKYKLHLGLPKAIYVEDFSKLKEVNSEEYGICNWYPAYLKQDSERIYPERTVIFNSFEDNRTEHNWANIDNIAEDLYQSRIMGTPHFLSIPIHEFSHAAHNAHLLSNYNSEEFLKKANIFTNPQNYNFFEQRYGKFLAQISEKAKQKPWESVADDMAQKICETLSCNTLKVNHNPFHFSSYPVKSLLGNLFPPQKKELLLARFWDGELP